VDEKGNIVLIDHKHPTPLLYDPSGEFLGKIGRVGSGPGEFVRPANICITKGNIYFHDKTLHGIVQYDSDYQYRNFTKLDIDFNRFFVLPSGDLLGFTREADREQKKLYHALVRTGETDAAPRTIHRFLHTDFSLTGSRSGGGVVSGGIYPHTPGIGMCRIDFYRICYGYSSEDQLYIYDTRTDRKTEFDLAFTTRPLTPRQQKYYRERESNPSLRPKMQTTFSKIMADEQGIIYLFRPRAVDDFQGPVTVDIYSPQGEYRCTAQSPHDPLLIRGGRMFYMDPRSSDRFLLKIQKFSIEKP